MSRRLNALLITVVGAAVLSDVGDVRLAFRARIGHNVDAFALSRGTAVLLVLGLALLVVQGRPDDAGRPSSPHWMWAFLLGGGAALDAALHAIGLWTIPRTMFGGEVPEWLDTTSVWLPLIIPMALSAIVAVTAFLIFKRRLPDPYEIDPPLSAEV